MIIWLLVVSVLIMFFRWCIVFGCKWDLGFLIVMIDVFMGWCLFLSRFSVVRFLILFFLYLSRVWDLLLILILYWFCKVVFWVVCGIWIDIVLILGKNCVNDWWIEVDILFKIGCCKLVIFCSVVIYFGLDLSRLSLEVSIFCIIVSVFFLVWIVGI